MEQKITIEELKRIAAKLTLHIPLTAAQLVIAEECMLVAFAAVEAVKPALKVITA